MGQLIKLRTLILRFVLLWDCNFSHTKVEQYAKNSDPVNEGEELPRALQLCSMSIKQGTYLEEKLRKSLGIEKDRHSAAAESG